MRDSANCKEETVVIMTVDQLRIECDRIYRVCDRLQTQEGAFSDQKLSFRDCTRLEIVFYLIHTACYEHRILNSEVRFINQVTGMYLTKEQIMSAVWGLYSDVEPSTVAVHVRWLREKLETDPSHPQLIRTGYVLEDSE